jgi:hypothetical protein
MGKVLSTMTAAEANAQSRIISNFCIGAGPRWCPPPCRVSRSLEPFDEACPSEPHHGVLDRGHSNMKTLETLSMSHGIGTGLTNP